MMTTEMMSNLSKIATRWTKGDMDRLYINIDAANELYTSIESREHGQLTLNRRERSMGKIWIDVATGEICTKGISDADEVASEIAELIAYLCPAEEETEEETETVEETEETFEIANDYGTVTVDGKTYTLTEPLDYDCANVRSDLSRGAYVATAVSTQDEPDDDGCVPEYTIIWYTLDAWEQAVKEAAGGWVDGADACDWMHPDEIRCDGYYQL